MIKCEPNVVEFIVNNSIHPGSGIQLLIYPIIRLFTLYIATLGEEIVRFLRARRILAPVTIVGVSNSQILHNYDNLYLAANLDNVWALNRYSLYFLIF